MAYTATDIERECQAARVLAGRMLEAVADEPSRIVMMAGAILGAAAAHDCDIVQNHRPADLWTGAADVCFDLVDDGLGPVVT